LEEQKKELQARSGTTTKDNRQGEKYRRRLPPIKMTTCQLFQPKFPDFLRAKLLLDLPRLLQCRTDCPTEAIPRHACYGVRAVSVLQSP
jgi:hypothetical protein